MKNIIINKILYKERILSKNRRSCFLAEEINELNSFEFNENLQSIKTILTSLYTNQFKWVEEIEFKLKEMGIEIEKNECKQNKNKIFRLNWN